MLEGLEIAEVSLHDAINMIGESRWDSEYYQKAFVLDSQKLFHLEHRILSDYAHYIRKGIFDMSPDNYQEEGVPFIRTSEIKEPTINFNTTVFLSEQINNQNANTILRPNDLVFTKIGAYIGDVAILPPTYDSYNFSQNVAGVSLKHPDDGYFLLAFFLTHFGQNQIKRSAMLSGQGKLELNDLRYYMVPCIGQTICEKINELIELSIHLNKQHKELIQSTTHILSEELNINKWKVSNQANSVKRKTDTNQAGRWDAEYFMPRYEDYKRIIENYSKGFDFTSNICQIVDTNYIPDNEMSYKYIELANIGRCGEITGCTENIGSELPTRARRLLKAGDVIVSSVEGSLQSCAIIPLELDGALCSTGFYVVRSSFFTPEVLLALFKSEPIQMLMKKGCSGTILTAIGKKEIEKIPLPLVDESIQKDISKQIQESFQLREESKRLLAVAKRTVEIAIEENEENALNYIKSNKNG